MHKKITHAITIASLSIMTSQSYARTSNPPPVVQPPVVQPPVVQPPVVQPPVVQPPVVPNPIDTASLNSALSFAPRIALTTLNGAHHRLKFDSKVGQNGWQTWVKGDFAKFDDADVEQSIAEVGINRSFFDNKFNIGLALGEINVEQETLFGGNTDADGRFLLLQSEYKINQKLILSSLIYSGDFDLTMQRGYNAGGAFSLGETDAKSTAIRLRTDWKNDFTIKDIAITPRLAYTYLNTEVDAYTETGGLNPAIFRSQSNEEHELRLGVDFDYQLNDKTSFRAMAELIHRFNDDNDISGISGSTPFTINTEGIKQTWGRIGLEAIHQFTERTSIHASIFTATEGYDATVSGAVGLSIQF